MFQQLYGSARGAAGKRLFVESADQLNLEAAAAAAGALSPRGAAAPLAPAPVGAAAAAGRQQAAVVQQQAAVERALQPSAKQNMDALSARLSGRMGGGGGEVQLGFDAPAVGEGAPAAGAGRKRLAAEPVVQAPRSAELMPPPPPRPSGGQADAGKRVRLEPVPIAAGSGRAVQQMAAVSGRAAPSGALAVAAAGAAPVVALPHIVLRGPEVPAEVTADLGAPPRLFADPAAPAAEEHRHQLRVTNRERAGGRLQAEVACLEGRAAAPLWSDTLRGAAVAACGTHNFAAVGLADGQLVVSVLSGLVEGQSRRRLHWVLAEGSSLSVMWHCCSAHVSPSSHLPALPRLQLYSAAGRHLTAPLKLGAGIAKLACDAAWRLLALTTSGAVRLFDVEAQRSLLTASLASLLEDGCTGESCWRG